MDNLNENERHLIELARKGWYLTFKEFYYPPLNEPSFIYDYSNLEGFYIDPQDKWNITMNLANAPLFLEDQKYVDYFHAITLHEVSHYQIIPYDGLMNAKLIRAAMNHVNHYIAPVVVNIFADLIIDKKLHKKYPDLIDWEIKCTFRNIFDKYKEQMSNFSKFLFRSYEILLDIQISQINLWEDVELLANKVVTIIDKNFEDETKWEEKVSKIAYHLKSLVNNTFNLVDSGYKLDKGKAKRSVQLDQEVQIMFPEDIVELLDNPLENRNLDKLKRDNEDELKKKAEEFARDTQYSEFGAPASHAGILMDGNPLATWYRGLSKNLIEIKITQLKPGGVLPIYPEIWRISDPIEDLDIVQTLLNSPIIIPNITTRKWMNRESKGFSVAKVFPDLLLVVDSSGSMNWNYLSKKNHGKYHTALLASFAALHYAAQRGVKFSVINFSNVADICDWTYDFHKAEQVLLRYQGGGTQLPIKSIFKQCEKSERTTLIFIITDFGIYNWSSSKKTFITLSEKGHKIVGFFIGSKEIPCEKFKDLIDKVKFYPILKPNDLIDLIINEVKAYYTIKL
jgi:hypothetical protein